MFVLCDRCHQHYEDQSQSKKCSGPGKVSQDVSIYTSHKYIAPQPIETHIWAVQSIFGKGGPNPRMTGESWPEGRDPLAHRSRSAVPTGAAHGSVIQLPTRPNSDA
jgi:hypothetical protein